MKAVRIHIAKGSTIRVFLLLLFFFVMSGMELVKAQQMPFSRQYYANPFVLNPAFTGNRQYSHAFMGHRSQWVNVKGAPQFSYLTLDAPIKDKKIGMGIKMFSYSTDIITQVGVFGSYSYTIKINEEQNVFVGLSMGMLNNKIDYTGATMRDKDDPFFIEQQQNKTVVNADLGLAYKWKKLEVGLAVPQLLGNKVKYGTDVGYVRNFNLARHYQTTVKYAFTVNEDKEITAYPMLLVRAVKGAPLQFDLNAVVDWKKIGWAGLTYHSGYALAVSAGVRYKNFSLGYSYDIGMNSIRTYTGPSTEFLLGYVFTKKQQSIMVDSTKNEIWAEQIQSTSPMIQPLDYDDEYWNAINKNVDRQQIFNTIVDAVLSGKLQAYDIVTGSPMNITKVKSSLVRLGDTPKLITKNDVSKIRMNEKWIFDRKNYKLTKQVTRIDLLITQLNDAGEITGNDKPLFFVKLKNQ
ncbi:MAG: type IX secretion system membrane protein PorP/SprF [Bacteroidia bacterium]